MGTTEKTSRSLRRMILGWMKRKGSAEPAPKIDKATEDLIAFVDGEYSTPGVDTYDFKFRTTDSGEVELVMAADDARGCAWGNIRTEAAGQLRSALLDWRRLIDLEREVQERSRYDPQMLAARIAKYPEEQAFYLAWEAEIAELRQRLFQASDSGNSPEAAVTQ